MHSVARETGTTAGPPARSRFAVGLGSNVGDRLAHLRFGRLRISAFSDSLRCSRVYLTEPRYVVEQPSFLNACCVGETRLTPRQLLAQLMDAERAAGRERTGARFGPRTLDLDLLLYGTEWLESEELLVPHPRLRERGFVLVPLEEVAGDWIVPGGGKSPDATVAELARRVGARGVRPSAPEMQW